VKAAASKRKAGEPRARAPRHQLLIVTGLSGSGKSQAIRALEDLGFFCVDNLPSSLMPTLGELSVRAGGEMSRVAIVADVREPNFVSHFPKVLRQLRASRQFHAALIFLEAGDETLLRRFSETRRPHPLAHNRPVIEGIRQERAQLSGIRALADHMIDTSDLKDSRPGVARPGPPSPGPRPAHGRRGAGDGHDGAAGDRGVPRGV
jgi:UPF0042 nucleotide-binding protein